MSLTALAREYWADRPMEMAAALSYYTLLSMAPLVLVTVALAGLVFERSAVEQKLVEEVRTLVGDAGAEVVHTVLRSAGSREKSMVSVLAGLAALLIGSTTVFVELQSALNRIWRVRPDRGRGPIRTFVKERLISFAMVLAVGFLLLVSLVVSAGLAAISDSTRGALVHDATAVQAIHLLLSVVVATLLFAIVFKVLPDVPLAWRDVWFGAAITSVLFTGGKYLIGLYLGRAGIGSAYGAAGSVVVFTAWVYYASLILFLGAKLTYFRSAGWVGGRARIPAGEPAVDS